MWNKILYIFCIICFITVRLNAQDIALAKQYFEANNLDNAKEQIDAYLDTEGSNDAQGWLLKAAIYTSISKDAQWKLLVSDGRMEAITSIKKAIALNKQLINKELSKNKFSLLLTIYQGYITDGIGYFNTATETRHMAGYAKALDCFQNALSVNSLAKQERWQVNWQPNIPSLRYNAAQAAINGDNEDAAVLYSRQLIDAGITSTSNYTKADFGNIYQWLVNYYHTKQDAKNLPVYAALGAKNYPDNMYFATILINFYQKTAQYGHLWPTYEKAIQQFPQQHELLYQYNSDLFAYIYKTETGKKVPSRLYQQLELNLKQYIQQQPDTVKGYWLIGKYYFNQAVDLQKIGAKSDSIKWTLNQAVVKLQAGISKCNNCDEALLKEIQLIICRALKAMGRQNAEMCYDE